MDAEDIPQPGILLAQDRDENFLVYASCHADYLKYLKGGDITPHAFLTMESYGPWDITKANDMENFAVIVVAMLAVKDKIPPPS